MKLPESLAGSGQPATGASGQPRVDPEVRGRPPATKQADTRPTDAFIPDTVRKTEPVVLPDAALNPSPRNSVVPASTASRETPPPDIADAVREHHDDSDPDASHDDGYASSGRGRRSPEDAAKAAADRMPQSMKRGRRRLRGLSNSARASREERESLRAPSSSSSLGSIQEAREVPDAPRVVRVKVPDQDLNACTETEQAAALRAMGVPEGVAEALFPDEGRVQAMLQALDPGPPPRPPGPEASSEVRAAYVDGLRAWQAQNKAHSALEANIVLERNRGAVVQRMYVAGALMTQSTSSRNGDDGGPGVLPNATLFGMGDRNLFTGDDVAVRDKLMRWVLTGEGLPTDPVRGRRSGPPRSDGLAGLSGSRAVAGLSGPDAMGLYLRGFASHPVEKKDGWIAEGKAVLDLEGLKRLRGVGGTTAAAVQSVSPSYLGLDFCAKGLGQPVGPLEAWENELLWVPDGTGNGARRMTGAERQSMVWHPGGKACYLADGPPRAYVEVLVAKGPTPEGEKPKFSSLKPYKEGHLFLHFKDFTQAAPASGKKGMIARLKPKRLTKTQDREWCLLVGLEGCPPGARIPGKGHDFKSGSEDRSRDAGVWNGPRSPGESPQGLLKLGAMLDASHRPAAQGGRYARGVDKAAVTRLMELGEAHGLGLRSPTGRASPAAGEHLSTLLGMSGFASQLWLAEDVKGEDPELRQRAEDASQAAQEALSPVARASLVAKVATGELSLGALGAWTEAEWHGFDRQVRTVASLDRSRRVHVARPASGEGRTLPLAAAVAIGRGRLDTGRDLGRPSGVGEASHPDVEPESWSQRVRAFSDAHAHGEDATLDVSDLDAGELLELAEMLAEREDTRA